MAPLFPDRAAALAALGLHELTFRAIELGATVNRRLPNGSREDRAQLLANADISHRLLVDAGFEKSCGWLAGLDSGSSWIHPETGERAEVLVRRWNVVEVRGGGVR